MIGEGLGWWQGQESGVFVPFPFARLGVFAL